MMDGSYSKIGAIVVLTAVVGGAILLQTLRNGKDDSKRQFEKVSFVRVRVIDLRRSLHFYRDVMGFREAKGTSSRTRQRDVVAQSQHQRQVLLCAPRGEGWQPYLLLEENKNVRVRQDHAAAVGIGRMCLLCPNVHDEVRRLAKLRYQPVAPPVTDIAGGTHKLETLECTIAAFCDPDGNLVEFVSFESRMVSGFLSILSTLRVVDFPMWVHVNVNVTCYETSWKAYQQLGFIMGTDYGRVTNNLYKALGIPDPGCAKAVSLIHQPKRSFAVDLIEWEDPKTVQSDDIPAVTSFPVSIAISVKDLHAVMDRLKTTPCYWHLGEPKVTSFPKTGRSCGSFFI